MKKYIMIGLFAGMPGGVLVGSYFGSIGSLIGGFIGWVIVSYSSYKDTPTKLNN